MSDVKIPEYWRDFVHHFAEMHPEFRKIILSRIVTLEAERDALRAQVERLMAPVSDEDLLTLNEKYGYFQLGDAQGGKSRSFADDLMALIAARASQPQTYESSLRAGMRQNYAQEADRAVDRLLDEKERI